MKNETIYSHAFLKIVAEAVLIDINTTARMFFFHDNSIRLRSLVFVQRIVQNYLLSFLCL